MSYLESILLFVSFRLGLGFTFKAASMASARKQSITNEDDPWKVSAVISAVMELFLSVLLLVGVAVTFITSQFVHYFDLEPPCTHIGCSHAISSSFARKYNTDHGKKDPFFKLCPNCCTSFSFKKQHRKRSLHPMYDTKIYSVQMGAGYSTNNSNSSINGKDIHNFDENSYVASDLQFVNRATCTEGIQSCKKFVKLKLDNSRSYHDALDPSQFSNKDCVSSMKSRSDAIFTNECNSRDCCEASERSMATFWMDNPCHEEKHPKEILNNEENHPKEILKNEDLSTQIIHDDHHYMLLQDKDEEEGENEELYHDSFEAILAYKLACPLLLKDDTNKFSEVRELDMESVQPLLSCVTETVSEDMKSSSKSLRHAHLSSVTLERTKTSICENSEDCKEPIYTNNECNGGPHYVLLDSDDMDLSRPKCLNKVHCYSVQPLPNGFLNDESDVPTNFLNIPRNMEAPLDTPGSFRSENSHYHDLDELGIKATALEKGQHMYISLDNNDDDDSTEALDSENMLSDCAQPFLQGIQEAELESFRHSLNGMGTQLATRVGCLSGVNIQQLTDTSTDLALPEENSGEIACMRQMICPNHFQAEELSQGFLSDQCDRCLRVSERSECADCDTVEHHIENQSYEGPLADFEIYHGLRKREKNNAGESLGVMESGCPAFADLFRMGMCKDVKSSKFVECQILVNGEALIPKPFETQLQKQRKMLEVNVTSLSEDDRRCHIQKGLCISDMEGMRPEKGNLQPESEQQSVGINFWEVKDHGQVSPVVAEILQQGKEDIQVENDQEEGVDILRQALWAERTMLATLETELENERNAAAVATSEAMAMISRLQEEKSLMQLEVAHLQRMAEEKAEYDEQAMAVLKEILFKREAEKHALEKEVELYRQKLLSEEKKSERQGLPIWTSSSFFSPSKMDNNQGFSSPEGGIGQLKSLPLLAEFYNSEDLSLPIPCKEQNLVSEEKTQQSVEDCAKTSEPRNMRGIYINGQVDCGVVKGSEGSESLLIESSGPNRPIFSTKDEETNFILEHLWVMEEELRDLRGVDRLASKKKSVKFRNCCSVREVEEPLDEEGVGACLPVHDVYKVCGKRGQCNGVSIEELEVSGDPKETAATESSYSLQATAHTKSLFPLRDEASLFAGHSETCAENGCAFRKGMEGQLVATDAIEQLAMRLRVLESDRDILKELREYFRHKDMELNLLQEISQHLRVLQQVRFQSKSTGAPHQDPVLPVCVKSCSHAMKKRRYRSDLWQDEVALLHQRSI